MKKIRFKLRFLFAKKVYYTNGRRQITPSVSVETVWFAGKVLDGILYPVKREQSITRPNWWKGASIQ